MVRVISFEKGTAIDAKKLRRVLKGVTGIDEPIKVVLKDADVYTVIYKTGKQAHISSGSYQRLLRAAE